MSQYHLRLLNDNDCVLLYSILSFGAPHSNVYKIIAEDRGEMIFETTQVNTQDHF